MTIERRQQSRIRVTISCIFGFTQETPRTGKVTSLSVRGCFVNTKALVIKGQVIYLRLWLPEHLWLSGNRWLSLQGEVSYHMENVGFGLYFADLPKEIEAQLQSLMEWAKHGQSSTQYDVPEKDG